MGPKIGRFHELDEVEVDADKTDAINVEAAGAVMDTDTAITADIVDEKTVNLGVTIETILMKDGLVDGRNVSVDGAKLDTIESNATADQVASDVSIVDSGGLITATEVEGALAENRTAININTAKATNVPTSLSEGTRTPTTYGITSDGGADDLVLSEANTTNGGILGADKWDEIVANTIHNSSDGSDHSFIDQDVTSGSSPTFDGANITGIDTLHIDVRKGSVGTIAKGVPVYISGYNASGFIEVEAADATNDSTMPAIGFTNESITNAALGQVITSGYLVGFDTSSFTVEDALYISVGGGLTNIKPTGTALIQKMGEVLRSHISLGAILVVGAGRINDLPNLPSDNVWAGDGSGVPVATNSPTLNGINITGILASSIEFLKIGTPTYDNAQDWMNIIQSASVISGFTLSNSRASAELDIASGEGLIKITDSGIGVTKPFSCAGINNLTLTDNATNYIYIDYNAGAPIAAATVTRSSIEMNRHFIIGRCYKNGATLTILNAAVLASNLARTEHERLVDVYGFQHASGAQVAESGTLKLQITAGKWYMGHNPVLTDALDTNVTDTFIYTHYGVSSWITDNAVATTIDYTKYSDGTDTLANLTNNKYGVHWVYILQDSSLYVLYGLGDYSLTQADDTSPPTNIPNIIDGMGELLAKIIVKQDGTLISIESAFALALSLSGTIVHNESSGLNDGDYKHLTAVQFTKAISQPFVVDNLHTAWGTGLSNEEVYRIDLEAGEILTVERVEMQLKGGGTQANHSVDIYDLTNTTVIASTTAGAVNTTGGSSGTGAVVLVRVTNSVGSDQVSSIGIRGYIT